MLFDYDALMKIAVERAEKEVSLRWNDPQNHRAEVDWYAWEYFRQMAYPTDKQFRA